MSDRVDPCTPLGGPASRSSSHLALGAGAEFDLIRSMAARWGLAARGLGNDCAILDLSAGERLVASTDTSVEDVHFRSAWLSPREIGYRAAMSAWSDLAAAAARPLGALLALVVPRSWLPALADVADGVGEAAREVGAPIVGGDTVGGPALVITMTVLGSAQRPLGRDGARRGERVYVTGALGGPRLALERWRRGETPDDATRLRFARPRARLRESHWLARQGMSAAIDISDGLVADLGHIAAASRARLVVDLDRVPRWPGATPLDAAASGEEYELACTAPGSLDVGAFAREFALPLTEIGHVDDGPPGVEVRLDGRRVDPISGYDHFSA